MIFLRINTNNSYGNPQNEGCLILILRDTKNTPPLFPAAETDGSPVHPSALGQLNLRPGNPGFEFLLFFFRIQGGLSQRILQRQMPRRSRGPNDVIALRAHALRQVREDLLRLHRLLCRRSGTHAREVAWFSCLELSCTFVLSIIGAREARD